MGKTPYEMAEMQKQLNADREMVYNMVETIRSYAGWDSNVGSATFVDAVNNLEELAGYRLDVTGWSEIDARWFAFRDLVGSESSFWRAASCGIAEYAKEWKGKDNGYEARIDMVRQKVNSIPEKQKNLYRARREWGREIIRRTKVALPFGAANQIVDLMKSGGVSVESVHMARQCYGQLGLGGPTLMDMASRAVVAEHFGAGNCGEQSEWALTEAYKLLPQSRLTILRNRHPDHVYLVIGPINSPESAYIDPWPDRASVADQKNYGLTFKSGTTVVFSTIADGTDLRAAVKDLVVKLPSRLQERPPMTKVESEKMSRELNGVVFHITSTREGFNSDSDSEDRKMGGSALRAYNSPFTAVRRYVPKERQVTSDRPEQRKFRGHLASPDDKRVRKARRLNPDGALVQSGAATRDRATRRVNAAAIAAATSAPQQPAASTSQTRTPAPTTAAAAAMPVSGNTRPTLPPSTAVLSECAPDRPQWHSLPQTPTPRGPGPLS
ncbi:hypothetical protein ACFW9I_32110 [[Kitasatospora] papulosa]|uniref:hypothetical protein n=1 Tax=[Kitasatospora] papulosa TaxID=1464011 RepID=UPI0036900C11